MGAVHSSTSQERERVPEESKATTTGRPSGELNNQTWPSSLAEPARESNEGDINNNNILTEDPNSEDVSHWFCTHACMLTFDCPFIKLSPFSTSYSSAFIAITFIIILPIDFSLACRKENHSKAGEALPQRANPVQAVISITPNTLSKSSNSNSPLLLCLSLAMKHPPQPAGWAHVLPLTRLCIRAPEAMLPTHWMEN